MSDRPTFEEAVGRLEEIVEHLERGDVPLDRTLELFREGIELRKRCDELLTSAQTQFKVLMQGANNATIEVDEGVHHADGASMLQSPPPRPTSGRRTTMTFPSNDRWQVDKA